MQLEREEIFPRLSAQLRAQARPEPEPRKASPELLAGAETPVGKAGDLVWKTVSLPP